MIGQIVSHYDITDKIGSGRMTPRLPEALVLKSR
jgi:hypothetical protein